MSPVQVTVLVITYNHARFIETAIESVMAQETDFEFEVVISEDCSTDGTREVVQRLAAAHPDRIRTLLSDRNLNDNSVVRRGVEAAQGRYLALLDGDDFWTSKHKLQRQVDFLEGRPDCSACTRAQPFRRAVISRPFRTTNPARSQTRVIGSGPISPPLGKTRVRAMTLSVTGRRGPTSRPADR